MHRDTIKKLTILTMLLASSACFAGCGTGNSSEDATGQTQTVATTEKANEEKDLPSETIDVFAMDTYMTLTAYGEGAGEALDACSEEITRIDNMLSTGISTSEIAMINANGHGSISEDTAYLLNRSKELYESTGGVFDITIYPVMEAWGFTTQNYRVPEADELNALRELMGPEGIIISEDQKEVTLAKEGMKIDLGGIAKGYTSQSVIDVLKDHGISHAVISLGGNVQLLGNKPDGSNWRVGVQDPDDTSGYIGVLEDTDVAVITSGGYERYFEEDGKTYHHIIDPATLYPAESGLSSVTIVSTDATLADGLSTSLFIMGEEKAVEYWKAHSDEFDMILMRDDRSVVISEGLENKFTTDLNLDIVRAQ